MIWSKGSNTHGRRQRPQRHRTLDNDASASEVGEDGSGYSVPAVRLDDEFPLTGQLRPYTGAASQRLSGAGRLLSPVDHYTEAAVSGIVNIGVDRLNCPSKVFSECFIIGGCYL
jgi:hypothetical protein